MTISLNDVDLLAANATLPFLYLFLFFGIDDFFIDVCAWTLRVKPKELKSVHLDQIRQIPEKRIAVLIAAWKEEGVLKHMIRGNLAAIEYENYSFIIGVYPNDLETLAEANELAAEIPNVVVVVNSQEGPTCKGQMLNVMVREILKLEKVKNLTYDAFIIHDSEDLVHRLEFQIVNGELNYHDFVQIPVFSLPVSSFSLVAGIYIDEFAESHTKSVLVRNKLGAPIPAAGVGTAVSRKLVLECLNKQSGDLLNVRSLTEDYELGLSTQTFGLKSKFSCYFFLKPDLKREYIATREYFPKSFKASVRQKSRWTLGIAFQGFENLGWKGSFLHRYFLFRDRKGPFCNALIIATLSVLLYTTARLFFPDASVDPEILANALDNTQIEPLIEINLFFMVNRFLNRVWSVKIVYGWKLALFSPIRWPLANVINFLASIKATQQYIQNKILGTQPKWIKTSHELPEGFGGAPELSLEIEN
ncbi:MAG: glycosyltransferase [Bdellovibrionia bacterium]